MEMHPESARANRAKRPENPAGNILRWHDTAAMRPKDCVTGQSRRVEGAGRVLLWHFLPFGAAPWEFHGIRRGPRYRGHAKLPSLASRRKPASNRVPNLPSQWVKVRFEVSVFRRGAAGNACLIRLLAANATIHRADGAEALKKEPVFVDASAVPEATRGRPGTTRKYPEPRAPSARCRCGARPCP